MNLNQILADPYFILGVFFVSCMIAIASLLSAMKQGGSRNGLLIALIFIGIAGYFTMDVFEIIGGTYRPTR